MREAPFWSSAARVARFEFSVQEPPGLAVLPAARGAAFIRTTSAMTGAKGAMPPLDMCDLRLPICTDSTNCNAPLATESSAGMTEQAAAPRTGAPIPADWAEDYDLYDPSYLADPFGIWQQMRQQCPVARTTRRGGGWMLSRHADVTAVAPATGGCSSRGRAATRPGPGHGPETELSPPPSPPP